MFDFLANSTTVAIANLATMLSLVLSCYVAISVRTVKRSYLFSARGPQLLKSLREHAANLSRDLANYDSNVDSIRRLFSLIKSDLSSLMKKVSREHRQIIQAVIDRIDSYQSNSEARDEDVARRIHLLLHETIQNTDNLLMDSSFTRNA